MDLVEQLTAAVLGRDLESVQTLIAEGADPFGPWDEAAPAADAASWAVERGDAELLGTLLDYADEGYHDAILTRFLPAARAWLEVAPGADPRPAAARWGVVTLLEGKAGIVTPPGELLARALHGNEPGSGDWNESVWRFRDMVEPETFAWAARLGADADPARRMFAAEVLWWLAIEEYPDRAEGTAVVRRLLRAETHPRAIRFLIDALYSFAHDGPAEALDEIRAFAGHPDPRLRLRAVAAVGESAQLLAMADDPDAEVRRQVLTVLAQGYERPGSALAGSAVVIEVLAAHLDDPGEWVALEAAIDLDRAGDPRGAAALDRFGDTP